MVGDTPVSSFQFHISDHICRCSEIFFYNSNLSKIAESLSRSKVIRSLWLDDQIVIACYSGGNQVFPVNSF